MCGGKFHGLMSHYMNIFAYSALFCGVVIFCASHVSKHYIVAIMFPNVMFPNIGLFALLNFVCFGVKMFPNMCFQTGFPWVFWVPAFPNTCFQTQKYGILIFWRKCLFSIWRFLRLGVSKHENVSKHYVKKPSKCLKTLFVVKKNVKKTAS